MSTKGGQPEIKLVDFDSSDTLDLRKVEVWNNFIACRNEDFEVPNGLHENLILDWSIYGGESKASMVPSFDGVSCDEQLNIIF